MSEMSTTPTVKPAAARFVGQSVHRKEDRRLLTGHGEYVDDVKLAGLLGLYLGWLGWSPLWVGTFAGFLLGGVAGSLLLALRRADRRTAIPFGPYMLAGALLALFVATPVAAWYGSLLTSVG